MKAPPVPNKDYQLLRLAHARLWLAEARLATCQAALDEVRRLDPEMYGLPLAIEGAGKADDSLLALCQLAGSLVGKEPFDPPEDPLIELEEQEPRALARIYALGVKQMAELALQALTQVNASAVTGVRLVRQDLSDWLEPWCKLTEVIIAMFPPVPREEEIPY